jgi:hypothetical protein
MAGSRAPLGDQTPAFFNCVLMALKRHQHAIGAVKVP